MVAGVEVLVVLGVQAQQRPTLLDPTVEPVGQQILKEHQPSIAEEAEEAVITRRSAVLV
jgi:hypothetical protein